MDGWNHKWTELPEGKGRIDSIQFLNKKKIYSSSRIGKKGIISRGANDPNWLLYIANISKCNNRGFLVIGQATEMAKVVTNPVK